MNPENASVQSVCQYGLSDVATACLLGFIACPPGFGSCWEENVPDPKSGRGLDPDRLGWSMPC